MSYTPQILITDDEPQICQSLKILLSRQGYDISTATSGRAALDLLVQKTFDLLLLDLVIPDVDGFQIMDHINDRGIEILTIVITGNASIESAVKALKKGAYDYIRKPFEYEELIKRVGNALYQQRLNYEKKVINGKLEQAEERYQYLVENSPDMIYMLDSNGMFTFVNAAVGNLLGYSPDRLIGKNLTSIIHQDDRKKTRQLFSMQEGSSLTVSNLELKFMVNDDESIFKLFAVNQAPIKTTPADMPAPDSAAAEQNMPGFYGVARDITYHKKLEQGMLNAKKMEAIGTLAGGIAHDFNNILMGIMGHTSLLLSTNKPGSRNYEKFKSIEQHTQSGADLTKQLLSLARGGKCDIQAEHINDIVEKTTTLFGRTKKEISLHCTLQEDICTVEVDHNQIEQVLLNMYVNAWQAMPQGGEIHIETREKRFDKPEADRLGLLHDSYAEISVRDTGTGMDEETRERIFEPFFTTKEEGKGTGLGLASAYGIIKNHGGTIHVSSEKNKGSTFTIYLPESDKRVAREEKLQDELVEGSGTILLVDDEEEICDLGAEILQTLGYEVITATSGKEALQLFDQNRDAIDIAIIDLVMPEMDGGELFDNLKALSPDTKTLLSSGYSIDGEASKVLARGCDGFIQKPFGIIQLSQKVKEILAADS